MGALVVDASVVIAVSRHRDPPHEAASKLVARWPRARALLPAVAYSEVMVEPLRLGRGDARDRELREAGFEIVPVGERIAREAARARAERPGLRLPDALVIATALVHGAELATLDRRMLAAFDDLKG